MTPEHLSLVATLWKDSEIPCCISVYLFALSLYLAIKSTFDDYLRAKTPHLALLKKGDWIDSVRFNNTSFYCGADDDEAGTTRCMLNVGFRNVKAQGNFEYKLKAIGTTFKLHF